LSHCLVQFLIDGRAKAEVFPRVSPPEELELICQDVKVCGRRELFALLKFRHKYQRLLDQDRKKLKQQQEEAEKAAAPRQEKNESELEAEEDKELEATIARVERERKKQEKRERERRVKAELRAKMSVIASTDIYNQNDDVLFDRKTLDKLLRPEVDLEAIEYAPDEDDEENQELNQDGQGTGIVTAKAAA